ncbi:AraC-like ligand-binding domain-containing protein [Thermomonospora cellulosilytica]|uniref:AraC-like DNA-binding protein n=1 Tax=Thermomonospora cellulosilytica TaxID=1411118 RepID=A0A7W3N2K0_9ACTN|nr:helix-turn-helix domain-containing protein [Thermomonospora cellulosilytica]MBA9006319.1 AraC-like DNA-binding protein [Thermomonospora cellulosilytica]
MLLLDTRHVPPAERVDAFHAAMKEACVVSRVSHEDPDGPIHARMFYWRLGRLDIFTSHNSGFRLIRTPRDVRRESPPVLALAIQARGVGRFEQQREHRRIDTNDLMLNDLTAPYDFSWSGDGGSLSFAMSHEQLGLPVDVIRRATFRLHTSPLYDLVQRHLRELEAQADRLSADPGAPYLVDATVQLARALIVSAAGGDDRLTRSVRAETMLTRIMAYARRHIADPDLTPALLAAVHNVSLRHLYKLFENENLSLEQWIITQRLEGARADLADPAGHHRTIASIALAWGFATPSHFTRRFRDAYGVTPTQWRRTNRPAGPGDAAARQRSSRA